jgi:hypothetical protein
MNKTPTDHTSVDKSVTESPYDAYIDTLDQSFLDDEGPWRHPVPPIHTRSISLDELGAMIPTLPSLLNRLVNLCDAEGFSTEHVSSLFSADEIGKTTFQTTGPVLVAILPKQLEGCLESLAARIPYLRNIESVDLKDRYTVAEWTAVDKTGSGHYVYISDELYYESLAPEYIDGEEVFSSARLVFIAGNQVVLSEFWEDSEAVSAYCAMYACSRERHSETELLEAQRKAEAAGSPTPWMFSTWRDDDDVYLSALARYDLGKYESE